MQFIRFKRGAQRLEPCPILEGLPGKALWRHQLSSNLLSNDWYCVTEEILVHTHLFHRGSSSQKAPQPGWPPASPTAPPGSQTNVRIHVHSWWSCCCCWSSVRTEYTRTCKNVPWSQRVSSALMSSISAATDATHPANKGRHANM